MADRWSKLAVAAFVDGTLDFSRSGQDQRLREEWVMREMEEREYARLYDLVHAWHVAGAWGDPANYDFHFERVRKMYSEIGKRKLPWLEDWEKMVVPTLHDIWERFVAQGKDPEEKKRIKKLQNWLDEKTATDAQDTQLEERMFAMLQHRNRERNWRGR